MDLAAVCQIGMLNEKQICVNLDVARQLTHSVDVFNPTTGVAWHGTPQIILLTFRELRREI